MTSRRISAFQPTRRSLLALVAGFAMAPSFRQAFADDEPEPGLEPDNLMMPVSANYQALKSYADAGTVETRYQWPGTPTMLVEHHRFQTAFRAPRNFFFRFDADPSSGGDAYVVWCDGGPFQSWWKSTGQHMVYNNGQGAIAFLTGESPTKNSVDLIAPHLFPNALYGATYRLLAPTDDGSDTVAGHACHRIKAVSRVTGVQTRDHRPTTVWVDDALGLIRKVQVEPEADSPPKLVDDLTYVVDPQANPELPDSRFMFAPPTG
jgi:hypothetical protein